MYNSLAVLALEAAPQQTVAEQYELDSVATHAALSSLFIDTANSIHDEPPTPDEANDEETNNSEVQVSEPVNRRKNPQAVGSRTVKRQSSTAQGS